MGIAVGKSIKEAEKYCKENDLKFTPVRRKVLEILLQKNSENYGFRATPGSTHELRSSRAPQKLRTVRAQLMRCTPALWLVCGGSC